MFESKQGKLLAIVLFIELLVMVGYAILNVKLGSMFIIPLYLLIAIPLTLLTVYDQDCLVIGGCNLWSWVRVILMVLFVILTVSTTVIMYSPMKAGAAPETFADAVVAEDKKDQKKSA